MYLTPEEVCRNYEKILLSAMMKFSSVLSFGILLRLWSPHLETQTNLSQYVEPQVGFSYGGERSPSLAS